MNREINMALRNMGLTNYEIQAYVALTSIISGTASEISVAANLPRPKIYETLKTLEKKGFIEINRTKPLKFTVIPPNDVFKEYRKKLKSNLDKAETELSMIYENQIPKVPAPLWILHGSEKLVKKELEIISRTEKNLILMGGFMFDNEISDLKKSLKSVIKKGIDTRIITPPYYTIDNNKINITHEFVELNCPSKVLQVPIYKIGGKGQ
jgi:sugar-specific transcriptional regulator TrmB